VFVLCKLYCLEYYCIVFKEQLGYCLYFYAMLLLASLTVKVCNSKQRLEGMF